MDIGSIFISSFCLVIAGIVAYYIRNGLQVRARLRFPPGPLGLPVLGNVFDIPTDEPWKAYKKLGEKYGDLVHLHVLTQDLIILNSYKATRDLFEYRSHNYSTRPYVPAYDLLDLSWSTGFIPYGDDWKAHRKIFQQALRSEAIQSYHPMMSTKTQELLRNLTDSPVDFKRHLRMFSSSITMAATYDYHPNPQSDPMVDNLKEMADVTAAVFSPDKNAMIAAFPFLMHTPWLLGAAWKHAAQAGRKLVHWWLTAPLEYVKQRMAEGPIAPCIVGDALSRMDAKEADSKDSIRIITGAAATSLMAASDTTDSTLRVFVLAMMLYPDVQRRAQEEIRATVGNERLPEFSDRPNLPYIEAILRETHRWHPVVPLSLPRSVLKDDVYRGYNFPKGITIIPNTWAIAHDEAIYPNPDIFNPSRFFDDQGNLNDDTVSYAFGFGRRICPGRILADSSVWLAIVSLLAMFSFEQPLDEMGKPIAVMPRYTSGLTSYPENFHVRINLRLDSEAHEFAKLLGIDE